MATTEDIAAAGITAITGTVSGAATAHLTLIFACRAEPVFGSHEHLVFHGWREVCF